MPTVLLTTATAGTAAGAEMHSEDPSLLFAREKPTLPLDVTEDAFQGGKSLRDSFSQN